MNKLGNDIITLRALEPEDVELLYLWENDPQVWGVSNTIAPFSRHILVQFIESQTQDIFQTRQLRLVIESNKTGKAVGAIDIFDFDPYNKRAGIGILIYQKDDRGRGYAAAAVDALIGYCFDTLKLHQIYCGIPADNAQSLSLFLKKDFNIIATKKDWLCTNDGWKDEYMLNLINNK